MWKLNFVTLKQFILGFSVTRYGDLPDKLAWEYEFIVQHCKHWGFVSFTKQSAFYSVFCLLYEKLLKIFIMVDFFWFQYDV